MTFLMGKRNSPSSGIPSFLKTYSTKMLSVSQVRKELLLCRCAANCLATDQTGLEKNGIRAESG